MKTKRQPERRGGAANMRRRLLVFLLILTFTVVAAVMFLLAATGAMPLGSGELEAMFAYELAALSSDISVQCGNASVQAVRLSEALSEQIAETMEGSGITFQRLSEHPEILAELLESLLPGLITNLDATDSSGVFVALDTTVNPDIEGAEFSKAGLYIRNIEPNIRGMGTENRYLLRGPASLAGGGRLNLQSKWKLEFDVTGQPFWTEPLAAREENPALALSRLVYWCSVNPLGNTGEHLMVCSAPLLGESGEAIGVCGFEINRMNFSLRHKPDLPDFHNAVLLFSEALENGTQPENALFSGNVAVFERLSGQLSAGRRSSGFAEYEGPDGVSLTGIEQIIRLSPNDSPFAGNTFSAALLIPSGDFNAARNDARIRFGLILFAIMIIGITAALILSWRYIDPFTSAFRQIREGNLDGVRTNIVEIDDLIGQLRGLRDKDKPFPNDFIEGFTSRARGLTQTEADIFRYYVGGLSDKEIISHIFITKSALLTHRARIYEKLGVSGKPAMMLYIELLKTSGLKDQVLEGLQ
jgi:DNA-binding CsgD family transcriptional regulator